MRVVWSLYTRQGATSYEALFDAPTEERLQVPEAGVLR